MNHAIIIQGVISLIPKEGELIAEKYIDEYHLRVGSIENDIHIDLSKYKIPSTYRIIKRKGQLYSNDEFKELSKDRNMELKPDKIYFKREEVLQIIQSLRSYLYKNHL